ncbi:MAG TPA: serine/threonine-protein kinase, partial [Kofleriaceae bacterium]|nr:serine/threonine-protein kinase [Kofleriaceae bacterium]
VSLPLPPPEDGGTSVGARVRMSQQLPEQLDSAVPILPAEPTTRIPRLTPPDLLDDKTQVDPTRDGSGDTDMTSPVDRAALAEALVDEIEDDTQVQRGRLPLPPPAEPTVGRPTLPGTKQKMSSQRPLPGLPVAPPPPPARAPTHLPARPKVARPPLSAPPPTPQPAPGAEDSTAVSTDPMAPLQGPLIGGRYRVVARIGQGGMGKVFKVNHATLGKTFALKIIADNFAVENKSRELFYREARLASSLSHPNIAQVLDFGEDTQHGAFMVMEFVEGEPLSKLLRREGRLGLRLAFDILLQVSEALHYIHGNRIIHCDIKTENILLSEQPGAQRRTKLVKLVDFGLAKSTSGSRTTGSLSGTPHYVAPERIRGEEASPASDIYGLGVLFYEVITGKVPWDGNVAQILAGHLELAPVPPSQLIEGGLDPAVENLVLRALAKTPAERHKDMAAFLYEMRTVMDMLGFSQRHKRSGGKKILIERTHKDEREPLTRQVFDGSRLPMAMFNSAGNILVANPAFAKFVMGVSVDVEGLQVQSTPLANAWPSFDADLARACGGSSVRRIVEVDVGPHEVRRLMIWLDPVPGHEQAFFGVHPLDDIAKP